MQRQEYFALKSYQKSTYWLAKIADLGWYLPIADLNSKACPSNVVNTLPLSAQVVSDLLHHLVIVKSSKNIYEHKKAEKTSNILTGNFLSKQKILANKKSKQNVSMLCLEHCGLQCSLHF